MKIGFITNHLRTEKHTDTTVRLALAAQKAGHEVWMLGMGDFTYEPDGQIAALAHTVNGAKDYRSLERFLGELQKAESRKRVVLSTFDVVMMRADPADDAADRPWANTAGLAFAEMLSHMGVLVVNDPGTLMGALSKAYFQHFPESLRPRTLISRDLEQIREFVKDEGGTAVLKPLQGSGGSGVFLVRSDEAPNLTQIVEAISRDGYVVVQEYLPEAQNGDVRMFVMNGHPLQSRNKYAAFRRRPNSRDVRSNMKAGGKAEKVEVTRRCSSW